jgi:O-antigen/teichoic acid export membrane protein
VKFISDSIIAIGAHIFVGISGLIINSLIGIYYSAEGLGIFSQGFSIYLLLSLLANCGIMISAQKHASQYSSDDETLAEIFSNTLAATAMVSLCIALCTYYLFSLNPGILNSDDVLKFVLLICITIPFFALNKTMNNFLVGLRIMNVYSGIRMFRWTLIIIGIFLLSLNDETLFTIPFIFLYTELLLFFVLIIYCKDYWSRIKISQIRTHIYFGIKNILAVFLGESIYHMPILMIGYVNGNESAGYFAYVLAFSRSILMIPGAIQKNFTPIFTKHWYNNEHEEIASKIKKIFDISLKSIIPVYILLYFFFLIYTSLLMPKEYLDFHLWLLVLLLGMSTIYLYGPFSTLLIMTDNLNLNLLRTLIFVLTTFILILFFVNNFGNIGAAYGISISMIINLFFLNYFYKRYIGIKLFDITILN